MTDYEKTLLHERDEANKRYAMAKGEIQRLKALRGEGALNEKLKDCGEAAKLAVAGLIMFREDAEIERDRYKAALEKINNIRVQDKSIVDAWKEARQIAFEAFDVP